MNLIGESGVKSSLNGDEGGPEILHGGPRYYCGVQEACVNVHEVYNSVSVGVHYVH